MPLARNFSLFFRLLRRLSSSLFRSIFLCLAIINTPHLWISCQNDPLVYKKNTKESSHSFSSVTMEPGILWIKSAPSSDWWMIRARRRYLNSYIIYKKIDSSGEVSTSKECQHWYGASVNGSKKLGIWWEKNSLDKRPFTLLNSAVRKQKMKMIVNRRAYRNSWYWWWANGAGVCPLPGTEG